MKSGFTLLELSIVLVIIGLIIGGITVGQELIKSAELNSVISDVDKYKTAVNSFKLKYNALPGDMNNAIDYWGAAHATPATCRTTASTGVETCDGNGDGIITITATSQEPARAWQHLANAEIISGNFDGIDDYQATSINDAELAFDGTMTGQAMEDANTVSGIPSGHVFALSTLGSMQSEASQGISSIATEDAKSIDDKIDDGVSDSGKVLAAHCNPDGIALEDFSDCDTDDCSYDFTATSGCAMAFFW